ncbi:transporter, major facilitator family protein [Ditylenchus destructor]|nr:transporter, major facilitator family protein [Ditylenchus destructor]
MFKDDSEDKKAILDSCDEKSNSDALDEDSFFSIVTVPHLRQALILGILINVPTLPIFTPFRLTDFFETFAQLQFSLTMTLIFIAVAFTYAINSMGEYCRDQYEQRTLIMFFGIGAQISCLLIVVCDSLEPLWGIMEIGRRLGSLGHTVCYGLFGAPSITIVNLVPPQNSISMSCMCGVICGVYFLLIQFVSQFLYEFIGTVAYVPIFVIPSVLSLIYLYKYLPETKNKTTQEIVDAIKRNL